MKPIRILHMIGSMNIGGSQIMMLNLYRAINRDVIQFDFILDHPEERALADQFEALGARIFTMPSFRLSNIADVKYAWDEFFKNHSEYKILHSHVRSYASIYIPIAKKYGLTTIIHSHNTSNGTGAKALLKALFQYPLRYQADYFFGCSEEAGRWLFGKKIVDSSRFQIIPNAIDYGVFCFRPERREQIRKELNLAGKYVIGHVGRFVPQKNHAFLVEVIAELRKEKRNCVLLLVGDGNLRPEIEKKCLQLQLNDAVIFVGMKSNAEDYYQVMDLFAFPSLYEGLGIAAVEAQAAGLRCLCSNQVPRKAAVTDLCNFLPMEKRKWVDAILASMEYERRDMRKEIEKTDFNVSFAAKKLQECYVQWIAIGNEKRCRI